jgi:hypothetical protein
MNRNSWLRGILGASIVGLSCLAGCSSKEEAPGQSGGPRDKVLGVENGGGSGAIGTPDRGGDTDPRRGSNAIGAESPALK